MKKKVYGKLAFFNFQIPQLLNKFKIGQNMMHFPLCQISNKSVNI